MNPRVVAAATLVAVLCFVCVWSSWRTTEVLHTPITTPTAAADDDRGSDLRCPLSKYERRDHTDFNVGPDFDAGVVNRKGPGEWRNTTSSCSAADTSHESLDGGAIEPIRVFTARCAEACLQFPADRCSGFVIRGDVCYMKLFVVMKYVSAPDLTSFVRVGWSPPPPRSHADRRTLFGVLAGWKYRSERLIPALSTWLCKSSAVVLLEDGLDSKEFVATTRSALPSACQGNKSFLFLPEPSNASVRSFNGAWKNLPLVRHMALHFGGAYDWFAIVDDDSFVIQPNLNFLLEHVVEAKFNPHVDAVAVGAIFTDGSTGFIQGGAGIFLSRAALHNMMEVYRTCAELCMQWAGDIRMGCCYPRAGVRMHSMPTFSSMDVFHQLKHAGDGHVFFSTFHQIRESSYILAAHTATGPLSPSTPSTPTQGCTFVPPQDSRRHENTGLVLWQDFSSRTARLCSHR